MDFDPTIESPMRSSTPVRGTDADEDEPTIVTTTDDIHNEQEPIPHDMPTTWSDSFTPLIVEPFIPTTKGLVQGLQSATTALDVFKMVFDVSLFDKVAEETNRYAAQKQQTQPDPVWTPTNTAEIQAFVGIHITMGLVRYPQYHLYWSKDDYFTNHGIANTMTRRRFEALERYLHVNDLSKMPRKNEPDFDPLYCVRPMIDHCREKFQQAYVPGRELSVDEGMIAYRGCIAYLQYIRPKKLKVGEYVARQKGGVVVTKWHDKREVSMMTTITDGMATPLTIQRRSKDPSKREVQMPAVIHQYNTYHEWRGPR